MTEITNFAQLLPAKKLQKRAHKTGKKSAKAKLDNLEKQKMNTNLTINAEKHESNRKRREKNEEETNILRSLEATDNERQTVESHYVIQKNEKMKV